MKLTISDARKKLEGVASLRNYVLHKNYYGKFTDDDGTTVRYIEFIAIHKEFGSVKEVTAYSTGRVVICNMKTDYDTAEGFDI